MSVYLDNTSIGTTTNESGEFILDHISPAKYRLIVSGVSFKTFSKMIDTRVAVPHMTIKLSAAAHLLKGAVVRAADPDGWVTWGALFTRLFVGTSPAARDCRILNPDVLKFRKNDDSTLTVYADKPILLHNGGLGYDIRYTLEDFTYDPVAAVVAYSGEVFFKDLALTSRRRAAGWRKARHDVYNGSFLHFKRAFYSNKLDSQGFELNRLVRIVNKPKQRAILLFARRPQLIDTVDSTVRKIGPTKITKYHVVDSTDFYRHALKEPDSLIDHQPIPTDSVGFMEDSTTAGLYFKDSLEVVFYLKGNPSEYKRISNTWHLLYPVSRITLLNKRPIYLLNNGFHYQAEDIQITGYWAWADTMGTILPFDYRPEP